MWLDLQIVIDIDEHIYKQVMADSEVYILDNEVDLILIENAIYNGTPLPEGHGRLIDGDKVLNDIIKKNPASVSKTEKSKEYARLVYYWAVKNAPTIIEADKGSDGNV